MNLWAPVEIWQERGVCIWACYCVCVGEVSRGRPSYHTAVSGDRLNNEPLESRSCRLAAIFVVLSHVIFLFIRLFSPYCKNRRRTSTELDCATMKPVISWLLVTPCYLLTQLQLSSFGGSGPAL